MPVCCRSLHETFFPWFHNNIKGLLFLFRPFLCEFLTSICSLIFSVPNGSFLSTLLNLLLVVIKPEINRTLTDGRISFMWSLNSLKLYVKLSICKHVHISGKRRFKGLIRLKKSKIKRLDAFCG